MTSQTSERLIAMANQIAANLAVRGDNAAAEETAHHIRAYWEPRMTRTLLAIDRSGLSPIAAEAVKRLTANPAAVG